MRMQISYWFDTDSDGEPYSPFSEHSGDPVDDELALNMIVGGVFYSLPKVVIKRHPDSYFARAVDIAEGDAHSGPIVIDRDGKLFKHIQNYLNFNTTRYERRPISWLINLRREACFYDLPKLVKICDNEIRVKVFFWGLFTLPSQSVLQPPNDECAVRSVLLSHLHQSSTTGTVDVSGISAEFYSSLVTHNVLASRVERKEKYHRYRDCSDFFLEDANLKKVPLSSGDYHTIQVIVDNIPLLPNIFMCVDCAVVMRITAGRSIGDINVPQECVSKMGSAYCILQAAEAGGSITVTQDGVTHTITQPGECVLYLQDGTIGMEPVTRGTLVLLYCIVRRGARSPATDTISADTTTTDAPTRDASVTKSTYTYTPIPTTACDALVTALHHDLAQHSSVVVPLTRLYDFVSEDLDNLCLVTDPSLLITHDAQLYEYLCTHFEVSVVTVCYYRMEGVCSACVLGPVLASLPVGAVYTVPAYPTTDTTTTTTSTDTTDTTLHPIPSTAATTSSPTPYITTSTSTSLTTSITTSTTTFTTTGVLMISAARGYGKYGVVFDRYNKETVSVSFVAGLQVTLKVDT